MRQPTTEQQAILDSTARVRVVQAAPGSGKTWLVAELIRKELNGWPANGGGIAALSFTRVGGEEIRSALGYELGHPHFVGTIDAFLFRYVVRPFLQRTRTGHAAPRLIPADWEAGHWRKSPGGVQLQYRRPGNAKGPIYDLMEICFIDEAGGQPVMARRLDYRKELERVADQDREDVLSGKRRIWQRLGWLTHADAALLASELLADPTHGTTIKALLLRRFPLLIVDELQDTGFFLGKSIRLVLNEVQARGVLVGDPDQAIYEFNGARPDLFDGFNAIPGSSSLPLARSQRCPAAAIACAGHLKDTPGQVDPAAGIVGRAFLVRYQDMVPDVKRIVCAIRDAKPSEVPKVVVRWNSTVSEFTSGKGDEVRSLHNPALAHLARAVQNFRRRHQVRALAGARAALELAVLAEEGVTDETLESRGIDPRKWKALAVECLLKANALDATLSMQQWQTAVGALIDAQIVEFGLPTQLHFVVGRLKPKNLSGKPRTKAKADQAFAEFAPVEIVDAVARDFVTVETVHAVKGETHDVTIVVWPPESKHRPCPSVVWWPTPQGTSEERRIAYVAMTRTRSDLVLCVSTACYQRLLADRADFAAAFQSKTVDEFIAAFP